MRPPSGKPVVFILAGVLVALALEWRAFAYTSPASVPACFIPFEWCQTGCPEIGPYSIAAFSTPAAEQAFIATLTPLQQETVRRTTFAANGTHIVLAYRVLTGATPNLSVTIGFCPSTTVSLRSYGAIDTASVEASHLSIDQRGQLAIFSVLPAPINDPFTRALLLVRMEAEHGDTDTHR